MYINCYQPINLCDHLHPRNEPNDSIIRIHPCCGDSLGLSMSDLLSGQSAAPSWMREVSGSKRSQRSTNNASMAMELDHNTFGEDLAVMP